MPNLLQTDERAYRICILYEALRKKPVEKAYKDMKEVKPNIDYLDFEYWYYRFLSGDHDLDYDRSKDPKTRGFSDMPIDVAEKVVGKLEVVDRLSLRKVSRNLRSIVDNEKTKCETVSIELSQNSSTLRIDYKTIMYESRKEGFCTVTPYYKRDPAIIKVNQSHWELAIKDFSSLFMNRNWSFGKIEINFDPQKKYEEKEEDDAKHLSLLDSILSSISSKIHVKELDIISTTLAPAVTLLPYFQPNTIKYMRFWSDKTDKRHLEQIMEMDHWKTADVLHLKRIPDWFDIQLLFHAKEFTVYICDLSDDRIRTVRDVLLKSKTLEWCSLGIESAEEEDPDFDEDLDALDENIVEIMLEDPAYSDGRYNVEGADYYFEITCDRWNDTVCLDVTRPPHRAMCTRDSQGASLDKKLL
ncbi:unnamed protein product [Caenorhabditis brenneri]